MRIAHAAKLGIKTLLALNGASVVRALRFGPRAGARSLQQAYQAVDPFSASERRPEVVLLRRIPEVSSKEAFAWPAEICLDLRFADISGSTPTRDILSFLALAMAQEPEAALEFGTFWGSTTANLARNLLYATIHTIDLPDDPKEAEALTADKPVDDTYLIESRQLGRAFRGTPLAHRIVQHAGDTATYDYGVIRDVLSFFLVDGSHTYEYAKNDTLVSLGLAKGPATIVWHDCDELHPGVTRWLGELVDAGLAVRRIAGTSVAYLRFEAADARIQGVLRGTK